MSFCRCYEMERRLKTPDLFKFPYFEAICWYVAKNLLETLKGEYEQKFDLTLVFMSFICYNEYNHFNLIYFFLPELREDNCPPPVYLVEGVKALITALKTWLKRAVRVQPQRFESLDSLLNVTTVWPSSSGWQTQTSCSCSPVWMWSLVALQVTEPTSEVPDHIRPNHLIKELTKEIRYLEVRKGVWPFNLMQVLEQNFIRENTIESQLG